MPKMVEMRPVTNPTNCRSSSRDRGVSFYRFFDARKSERSAKAKQCLRRSIKLMLDSYLRMPAKLRTDKVRDLYPEGREQMTEIRQQTTQNRKRRTEDR